MCDIHSFRDKKILLTFFFRRQKLMALKAAQMEEKLLPENVSTNNTLENIPSEFVENYTISVYKYSA